MGEQMNWWSKIAMPLPRSEGLPSKTQLERIDEKFQGLPQSRADEVESEHGPLSYLGHGSNGIAFQSPRSTNSVVKLTGDPSEARAATMQMQKESPCLLKVYGVRKLHENDNGGFEGNFWQIVTEKVTQLTSEENGLLGRLLIFSVAEPVEGVLPLEQIYLRDKYYFKNFVSSWGKVKKMHKKLSQWFACMKTSGLICYLWERESPSALALG